MDTVLLVALAVAGAALQRGVGAGYSLLLLPGALVALPDGHAVACVLGAGTVLTGGLLLRHGRPRSLGGAAPALAAAPAGQALAAVALGALDGTALRIVAAVVLAVGCGLTAFAPAARPRTAPVPPAVLAAAGAIIGAIGALTGVIGPFFALLLVAVGERAGEPPSPEELRRRLWTAVGWLSLTGLAVGALAGTTSAAGALAGVALAPALAAGAVLGAPLGRRLAGRGHRRVVLGVAALGVVLLAAS